MSYNVILYKKKPINKLCFGFKNFAGRNNSGKICVRAKKSLTKFKYRVIDFTRNLWNVPCTVIRVEYDPNRSCYISLLSYSSGVLSYIISPDELIPGTVLYTSDIVPIRPGNSTYLKKIPFDIKIHNIEVIPGKGGVYIRSAGCYGEIIEKFKDFCIIKFNSGELKQFSNFCVATIGSVSNNKHKYIKFKSAGDKRLKKRKKSIVRGVAKNAVDHPHGGGKGKKSPRAVSYSPWRRLGKNFKTKKNAK